MSKQILVPDVGEADEVSVIEILVNIGDVVSVDDSLVVLESEKASMEIPSPFAGRVTSITIKEGDEVDEGDLCWRWILQGQTMRKMPLQLVKRLKEANKVQTLMLKRHHPIVRQIMPPPRMSQRRLRRTSLLLR